MEGIAIIPELGGKKVFIYADGTAEPRTVTTGIRTENEVQVIDGLVEGDLVITTAILQLRPGLEIEIEEADIEEAVGLWRLARERVEERHPGFLTGSGEGSLVQP